VGARVADSVLTALEYLNKERKQIHRDVKPSNVLVNCKGIIGEKKEKKIHRDVTPSCVLVNS